MKVNKVASIAAMGILIAGLIAAWVFYERISRADSIYYQAVHNQEEGRLVEAERGYRRAIELNPRHANAHYELASIMKGQKKITEALRLMRKAIELDGNEPDFYAGLGFLYFNDLKDAKLAKHNFERAHGLNQENYFASFMLGKITQREGDYDKAIGYYKKALQVNPNMTPAYEQLLIIYDEKGMKEDAKNCRDILLKLLPSSTETPAGVESTAGAKSIK